MVWRKDGPQCHEVAKIRWELVPYTRGRGLDLGCGPEKGFPHFRGIDSNVDEKMFGIAATGADFIIPTCEVLEDFATGSQDFVFSSHLLEHIEDYRAALKEWWRVLKQGGHLCLYLPHKELYPNIGADGANPDHKHDFMPQDIVDAMLKIGGWDLVRNEDRNEGTEYSFFQVYRKYSDAKVHNYSYRKPKPAKTCAIVRYGAWGDVIQMSSILPALKAEGYHITLYTVPRAWEAVKEEPLIDEVILQDPEQVPNPALGEFWKAIKAKYDRFINLSESVEGMLLALPDRTPYFWNKETRDRYMNHNYWEFTHAIAGVKFEKSYSRFVTTEKEREWARKEKRRFAADPLIMWVLSGSSIHKVWPHMDPVLARLMLDYPQAKVITVGDERCKKLLEQPWENEPRIIRRSGDWTIRETMAMALECDIVVGPETGVMSAVSAEPMAKIVLLSHSSHENLTKHWTNAFVISSSDTPCSPCHKMIYNWDQCVKAEKTGTALCMESIGPGDVWNALEMAIDAERKRRQPAQATPIQTTVEQLEAA